MLSKSKEKQQKVMGKILVVDDEANARQTLAMLLEESGFEVRAASDGIKALGILKSEWTPDIVLTDLRMPLMDGFELIRKIKESNTMEQPAIVVMTAFASVESAVEVMKQGAGMRHNLEKKSSEVTRRLNREVVLAPADAKVIKKLIGKKK